MTRGEGFIPQLPDTDPAETAEWLDALDAVVNTSGAARAEYLLAHLRSRAQARGLDVAPGVTTPYINSIPTSAEPWFPGDVAVEKRIRALVRWNAVAMVVRANREVPGIGGHLSTFASTAALYEVGMNWFFRGKGDGLPGDAVYFQGHASPGLYARAYLEGRLNEGDLDRFRREVGGGGLSSLSLIHI